MRAWLAGVVTQTDNPTLRDTVTRYGADPARKLRRSDRLVGPLLLARAHGIATPHLTRALAAALLYTAPGDVGAVTVQQTIAARGLRAAVVDLCGLAAGEEAIVSDVVTAYTELQAARARQ